MGPEIRLLMVIEGRIGQCLKSLKEARVESSRVDDDDDVRARAQM